MTSDDLTNKLLQYDQRLPFLCYPKITWTYAKTYLSNKFVLFLVLFNYIFYRFDKDENVIDEPFFLSSRLDMVDKCRAIVMLFSKDYMTCPVTVSETKVTHNANLKNK